MKIAFINGKGGVGKSTLCYLVALALAHTGNAIKIVDFDPQDSALRMVNPERDGISIDDSPSDIYLIDTKGNSKEENVKQAISIADQIIIPVSPSPIDLTSLPAAIELVNGLKRPETGVSVLISQIDKRTYLSRSITNTLDELGINYLPTMVPVSTRIQQASVTGWQALTPNLQSVFFKLALDVTTAANRSSTSARAA